MIEAADPGMSCKPSEQDVQSPSGAMWPKPREHLQCPGSAVAGKYVVPEQRRSPFMFCGF